MLPGLQQGQEKMSKSDPSSSIFMEDEEVGALQWKSKSVMLKVILGFYVWRAIHICSHANSS